MVGHNELHQSTSCKCSRCARKRKAAGIVAAIVVLGILALLVYPYLSANSQFQQLLSPSYRIWTLTVIALVSVGLGGGSSIKSTENFRERKRI
jgi:hypothetical protein